MERCNFYCTSCYLSDVANRTSPLPFSDVKSQLDSLRAALGSGGKVQITSGEVTLLPVEELGRIIAYARGIGLDPMVMTNGQRFVDVPDHLSTLVGRYGLSKVSIHIDTTQRGRVGMKPESRERELHPVRDHFANLIRAVRRETGRDLQAAHTVTVTERTVSDIPDVMTWALANSDVFRIMSFLPAASVGRTEDEPVRSLDLEGIWKKVCDGVGRSLNRNAMQFGHTECNITVPLLVATFGSRREIIEVVRAGKRWDRRVFRWVLREFMTVIDLNERATVNAMRLVLPLLGRPHRFLELVLYSLYRLVSLGSWPTAFTWSWLKRQEVQVRPLLLVVHKFMSPDELDTPLGRERLQACILKVAVDGQLVSMCEMNGTSLRRDLNILNRSDVDRSSASRTE